MVNPREIRPGVYLKYPNGHILPFRFEDHERLKDLKPVELTADMMARLGFVPYAGEENGDLWEKRYGDISVLVEFYSNGSISNLGVNHSFYLDTRMLHQLQNLWFALTDNHLEYKENGHSET